MNDYLLIYGSPELPTAARADELVARYEWFAPARIARRALTGREDSRLLLTAPWRVQSPLEATPVNAAAITTITADDVIDRFLREEDLRIVAQEGEADAEVLTEARLDEDDDLVSEELAEIYLAQGLSERAIAIYRKLSLLNPEKSVYFAELIGKIENNN